LASEAGVEIESLKFFSINLLRTGNAQELYPADFDRERKELRGYTIAFPERAGCLPLINFFLYG
jgi:hypothetical protein